MADCSLLQQIEALTLLVESSEIQHKAVIETTAAEHAPSAVAPTQSTLKLSFFDVAPMLDVPPNGSRNRLHDSGACR